MALAAPGERRVSRRKPCVIGGAGKIQKGTAPGRRHDQRDPGVRGRAVQYQRDRQEAVGRCGLADSQGDHSGADGSRGCAASHSCSSHPTVISTRQWSLGPQWSGSLSAVTSICLLKALEANTKSSCLVSDCIHGPTLVTEHTMVHNKTHDKPKSASSAPQHLGVSHVR